MAFAAVGVRPFGQQMAACSCAGGESSAKRLQGKPPDGKDDVLFVASFCAFVNPHSYIFPHSKALHFHSSQPLLGLKQNVKSSLSFSWFFFLFFLKTNVWETKRFLGSRDKLGRASVQICGKVSTFGIPALYLQLWTSFLTTTKKNQLLALFLPLQSCWPWKMVLLNNTQTYITMSPFRLI